LNGALLELLLRRRAARRAAILRRALATLELILAGRRCRRRSRAGRRARAHGVVLHRALERLRARRCSIVLHGALELRAAARAGGTLALRRGVALLWRVLRLLRWPLLLLRRLDLFRAFALIVALLVLRGSPAERREAKRSGKQGTDERR
jgi:hypothetical protein